MRRRKPAEWGPRGRAAGAAVALTVGGAGAATIATLDAGGVEVATFAATERTHLAGPGTVEGFFLDIRVEHFLSSRRTETMIEVIAPDGASRPFGASLDSGWGGGPGVFEVTGGFAFGAVRAHGASRFLFCDSFPDGLEPGHVYPSGATIELQAGSGVGVNPLPAGLPLLPGALGMPGLVRPRQQRSAGSGLA